MLYKKNLIVLSNLSNYQLLSVNSDGSIFIDNRYFKYYRGGNNDKRLPNIIYTSLFHYIILLSIKPTNYQLKATNRYRDEIGYNNLNRTNSITDLDKLNYEEKRKNLYLLLKKSIESLQLFIDNLNYYKFNVKYIKKIEDIYTKAKQAIESIPDYDKLSNSNYEIQLDDIKMFNNTDIKKKREKKKPTPLIFVNNDDNNGNINDNVNDNVNTSNDNNNNSNVNTSNDNNSIKINRIPTPPIMYNKIEFNKKFNLPIIIEQPELINNDTIVDKSDSLDCEAGNYDEETDNNRHKSMSEQIKSYANSIYKKIKTIGYYCVSGIKKGIMSITTLFI